MGFFSGLGKMLQGKPVFEDSTSKNQADSDSHSAPGQSQTVDTRGEKIIPEFEIEKCQNHENGQNLEIRAWITNTSTLAVELDWINLLGQKYQLDYKFQPGQGHEMVIYRGLVPKSTSNHTANLIYKTLDGDYFQADYQVEFDQESDGRYRVSELHLNRPVRDT